MALLVLYYCSLDVGTIRLTILVMSLISILCTTLALQTKTYSLAEVWTLWVLSYTHVKLIKLLWSHMWNTLLVGVVCRIAAHDCNWSEGMLQYVSVVVLSVVMLCQAKLCSVMYDVWSLFGSVLSSHPPTAHWTSTGLPSRTSYHPALCFSSSVIFLLVDACVGLNWLLVSFFITR